MGTHYVTFGSSLRKSIVYPFIPKYKIGMKQGIDYRDMLSFMLAKCFTVKISTPISHSPCLEMGAALLNFYSYFSFLPFMQGIHLLNLICHTSHCLY